MTVNAAGSNTSPPLTRPYSVTSRSLKTWYRAILRQEVNSVVFSKPAKKAASRAPGPGSKLEAEFALQLRAHGVTGWTREFRFHPTRKWRFDFAFPEQKVAIELHGATYSNGRHNRGTGMRNDADKTNAAQLMGWLTLTFTSDHLKDGTAMQHVMEALGAEP
jgi:very-short-patch-repair endonuclease